MPLQSKSQRTLLLGFLGCVAACGVIGIYCLLKGTMGRTEERILATTALASAAMVLGMGGVVVWEHRRWPWVACASLIAAPLAFLATMPIVWFAFLGSPWYEQRVVIEKTAGISWIIAAAFVHIGLLSFARLQPGLAWALRWTVVAIAVLTGTLVWVILWEPPFWANDLVVRFVGVLAIIDVCGTLAVPVLHRVSAIKARESIRTFEPRIVLTCPRCGTMQELPRGRSRCRQCELRFTIDIEEDQCGKCGYPLYRLEGGACPECGTPIRQLKPPA